MTERVSDGLTMGEQLVSSCSTKTASHYSAIVQRLLNYCSAIAQQPFGNLSSVTIIPPERNHKMAHLIDIKDMYKIYNPGENEVRALDGVSLTVERGEFVAIVGQSGSGKSTLMNMLGLLDVASSGTYFLDGKDVAHFTDDELSEIRNKQIGFIFQGFNLISSLTAQANVELPLVYRGMRREDRNKLSLAALERVGILNRKNHLPSQLSGGQQQRAAIARAVAAKPPVILADEPTGNLDSHSGEDVMRILHELSEEGRTIILITHDNDIAKTAKRVIRIHDGKIIEDTAN